MATPGFTLEEVRESQDAEKWSAQHSVDPANIVRIDTGALRRTSIEDDALSMQCAEAIGKLFGVVAEIESLSAIVTKHEIKQLELQLETITPKARAAKDNYESFVVIIAQAENDFASAASELNAERLNLRKIVADAPGAWDFPTKSELADHNKRLAKQQKMVVEAEAHVEQMRIHNDRLNAERNATANQFNSLAKQVGKLRYRLGRLQGKTKPESGTFKHSSEYGFIS